MSAPGQADAPPRTAALPPLPAELKQPPPATAVPAKAQQLHVVPVLLQDSTGGAASSTSTDDVKHDQLQHRGSDAADSCVVGSPHVAPKTAAGGEVETAAVRQSSPTPASAAVAASDVSDSGNCTGGGSSAAATAAAEACSEDGGGRGEALAAIAATFKQAPNVAPAAEAVEAPAAAAAAGEAAAAAVEAQAAAAPAATANTATAPAAAEASAQAAPAADSTSYGAAAASLADPACRCVVLYCQTLSCRLIPCRLANRMRPPEPCCHSGCLSQQPVGAPAYCAWIGTQQPNLSAPVSAAHATPNKPTGNTPTRTHKHTQAGHA